ncbi:MAG: restriction endonuclease [Acidobacteria bacterium]|nr:restriction endonuclease [Acidobacteriota bacterium]
MRTVNLTEWESSRPIPLSAGELAELVGLRDELKLTIEPAGGPDGGYILKPGSTVGALDLGGLSVAIHPKLPIGRVLHLASWALGSPKTVAFRPESFGFKGEPTLVEALVPALALAARRAFARGLLHGYRTEEEALTTVRGRIRVDEQIRRRFGVPIPVEVRYDDFTDDLLPNRLVKAAAHRLSRLQLRSPRSRRDLGFIRATLDNVKLVEFPPNAVPDVRFDRLNEYYREVITLARLILRHTSIETGRGRVRANGFLMDMNVVFQEFVTRALREELGLTEWTFPPDGKLPRRGIFLAKRHGKRPNRLDAVDTIALKPDLSWWEGPDRRTCTFVGDAKYKRVQNEQVPNADIYQLLAYTTALDLPGGLLIYAQGEAEDVIHHVRHAGKQLEIATLDLSGSIEDLKAGIGRLAERVRALRRSAIELRQAA